MKRIDRRTKGVGLILVLVGLTGCGRTDSEISVGQGTADLPRLGEPSGSEVAPLVRVAPSQGVAARVEFSGKPVGLTVGPDGAVVVGLEHDVWMVQGQPPTTTRPSWVSSQDLLIALAGDLRFNGVALAHFQFDPATSQPNTLIRLVATADGAILNEQRFKSEIKCLAIAPATRPSDEADSSPKPVVLVGTVWSENASGPQPLGVVLQPSTDEQIPLRGLVGEPSAAALTTDSRLAALAAARRGENFVTLGELKVWSLDDPSQPRWGVSENLANIHGLIFRPDSQALVLAHKTAGGDPVATLFAVEDGAVLSRTPPLPANVTTLKFTPEGSGLVLGLENGLIQLHRADDLAQPPMVSRQAHVGPVQGVGFAKDTHSLISIGRDSKLLFWEPSLWTPPGSTESLHQL